MPYYQFQKKDYKDWLRTIEIFLNLLNLTIFWTNESFSSFKFLNIIHTFILHRYITYVIPIFFYPLPLFTV